MEEMIISIGLMALMLILGLALGSGGDQLDGCIQFRAAVFDTQAGAQVTGADKECVHTGNRGNIVNAVQRFRVFDLQHHEGLFQGVSGIFCHIIQHKAAVGTGKIPATAGFL